MRARIILLSAAVGAMCAAGQDAALPAPHFHHLHLNATNPDAAIDFYVKQFPSTEKTTFAGQPALKAGPIFVLFTKVNSAPPLLPQSAFWHFGWHVTDERAEEKRFKETGVKMLPLYTGDGDASVWINSDSWPGGRGPGGALGRTQAQIAEAKEKGIQPTHAASGFAYIGGPDGAKIEVQGNLPKERFNHVHMYQDEPFCAQLWYQEHLNAPKNARGPQHTKDDCKVAIASPEPRERSWPALDKGGMYRVPGAGTGFDDGTGQQVTMQWYMRQEDQPLAPSRGQLMDHVGLAVANLDAWAAKLKAENVKFLRQTYKIGDTRAFMIEGPSHEAIELIEIR